MRLSITSTDGFCAVSFCGVSLCRGSVIGMPHIPAPPDPLRFAFSGQPGGRFRPFPVLYPCRVDEQAIRFTADEGGRRIAWASSGSGPPLVFSGWWMSHLELNWRDPRFHAYVETLG